MDQVKWTVERRVDTGKGANRKLRAAGKIPGNVYGKDLPNESITVDYSLVEDLIRRGNWNHALINLDGEGLEGLSGKVFIIKEMQRHHLSGRAMTLDLTSVRLDRKITVDVPLVIHGAEEIKKTGALLDVQHRSLAVQCLPTQIPSEIEVDASHLELGQTLHLRNITLPEGVETELPDDYPLCTAQSTHGLDLPEETVAAEGEEAEGEEAAGDKKSEE